MEDKNVVKKTRSSNFELLRVLAMLMIVLLHVTMHWPRYQLINENSQRVLGNGLFSYPVFYKKLLIINMIMPMGRIGNGLFIMISGYFMANKAKIDLVKISKKLLSQLGYVTVLLLFCSSIVFYVTNRDKLTYFNLIKISDFNFEWWFIGYYFVIMLLAAVVLNKYMINAEKIKALTLIVVVFTIVELQWTGNLLYTLSEDLRTLGIGVFYYLMGGYIRKYNPFEKVRGYIFFVVIIVMNIIYGFTVYNITQNEIQNYIWTGSEGTFIQPVYYPADYDIMIVVIVISVFEIFRRLRIPNSKVINYLGASTFTVYLIHENRFFRNIYNNTEIIVLLQNHPFLFCVELVKWTLINFAAGVIVYALFNLGAKICKRLRWVAIKE